MKMSRKRSVECVIIVTWSLEFPWTMSSIVVAQGLGLPLPLFISANLFTLVKVAYMKSLIKILQSFMAHSFLPNIIYVAVGKIQSHIG